MYSKYSFHFMIISFYHQVKMPIGIELEQVYIMFSIHVTSHSHCLIECIVYVV